MHATSKLRAAKGKQGHEFKEINAGHNEIGCSSSKSGTRNVLTYRRFGGEQKTAKKQKPDNDV